MQTIAAAPSRKPMAVLMAGALLLLGGCSGDPNAPAAPPPPPLPVIQSFTASPAALEQGGSTQLAAVFSGGPAFVLPGNLSITSGVPLTISPAHSTDFQLLVGLPEAGGQTNAFASVAVASPGVMLFVNAYVPALDEGEAFIAENVLDASVQPPAGTAVLQGLYPRTRTLGQFLGALAVDRVRNLLYASDEAGEIQVWHNAGVLPSLAAPDRVLTLPKVFSLSSMALDAAHDRLYVCASSEDGAKLYVLDGASTLDGAVTPSAVLEVFGEQMTLDTTHDRLYVLTSGTQVQVLEAASTLTAGALPSRAFSFTELGIFAILADGPGDRFYLAAGPPPGAPDAWTRGLGVFGFDHAGALSGPVADAAGAAALRIPDVLARGLMLDGEGRLYVEAIQNQTADASPKTSGIGIYGNASALTGEVAFPPAQTIWGRLSSQGQVQGLNAYAFQAMDWLGH